MCFWISSEDEPDEFEVLGGVPGPAVMRGMPEPVRFIGHNPFLDVSHLIPMLF